MSNATVSSPWLIVWFLGVFGHLLVGFVKPFTPVVGFGYLFGGFCFILRVNLNINLNIK
jgi:hypothetical protein